MIARGINFRFRKGPGLSLPAFLLLFLLAPASYAPAQTGGEVVVTSTFANVRSGPGTKYTRLGRVYRGERYSVTDVTPEWYEIAFKGGAGWIFGELVRLEKAGPSQVEINQVSAEIAVMNQRLDKVLERIGEANDLLSRKLEAQAAEDAAKQKGKSKEGKKVKKLPAGGKVSPAWLFIPGGPRLAVDDKLKGYGMLAAAAGCVSAGILYDRDYRDYRDQYRALPPGTPAEEFDRLYNKFKDNQRLSRIFMYTAAGLYACNALDYFFLLPRSLAGLELRAGSPVSGRKVQLSLTRSF